MHECIRHIPLAILLVIILVATIFALRQTRRTTKPQHMVVIRELANRVQRLEEHEKALLRRLKVKFTDVPAVTVLEDINYD